MREGAGPDADIQVIEVFYRGVRLPALPAVLRRPRFRVRRPGISASRYSSTFPHNSLRIKQLCKSALKSTIGKVSMKCAWLPMAGLNRWWPAGPRSNRRL